MLNVLSLFSGIGAFEKALDNLNIPYNLLAYCEIDKFASKAYSIIHNVSEDMNLKDVNKITPLDISEDVDLITYGFPCQDISNSGNMKGFTDENGERTRSGLFYEALRIINDYKPKFAIAENVKALTYKSFEKEFKIVLESLEEAGYNNYWQVLNAKDYGIPQNRERIFIISIRKDIDKGFEFPQPIPLELRLKDMLDDNVDESFYLKPDQYDKLIENPKGENIKTIGFLKGKNGRSKQHQSNTVYDTDGLCPSQYAVQYKDPFKIREATKRGYAEAFPGDSINLEHPNSKTRRGRVDKEVAQTLTTSCNQAVVNISDFRIRKLTPTECYKLMGFTAEDCIKAFEGGITKAQLYKQAGNSIVVNVLMMIFISFGEIYEEYRSAS